MGLKDKEQKILDDWKLSSNLQGDNCFNYDGLILRGKPRRDEKGNWYYVKGEEEKNWCSNLGKRILVISKDLPYDCDEDIRIWTCRDNSKEHICIEENTFMGNLARWIVGVYDIITKGKYAPYDELDETHIIEVYDSIPLARINCKKETGKGTCSDEILKEYCERYKRFLKEQIMLYDADIIICCGVYKVIESLLRSIFTRIEHIETRFKKNEKWIYKGVKNDNKSVYIIDSYHPSYPMRKGVITKKDAYEDLMWNFFEAYRKLNGSLEK